VGERKFLPVAFQPNTARRAAKNACLPAARQTFLPAPRGLFGANTIFRANIIGAPPNNYLNNDP